MLIEGGNSRSKMIGDELFKVTGDLMNIQKKKMHLLNSDNKRNEEF